MKTAIQHSIILFSVELFSDTRLSQQPTGGVLKYFEDWLAGVQRSSRQKKPLKMQNKPNFRKSQMNVNTVLAKDYENKRLADAAKTNPIQTQYKANTNPIQSQNKPNQTQPVVSLSNLFQSQKNLCSLWPIERIKNPGNHLLSPLRTTIGRAGLASEFGMGSGVSLPV